MIFSSWIDEADLEKPYFNELYTTKDKERVCTFCDRDAVALLRFGSLNVHLCDAHIEPKNNSEEMQ